MKFSPFAFSKASDTTSKDTANTPDWLPCLAMLAYLIIDLVFFRSSFIDYIVLILMLPSICSKKSSILFYVATGGYSILGIISIVQLRFHNGFQPHYIVFTIPMLCIIVAIVLKFAKYEKLYYFIPLLVATGCFFDEYGKCAATFLLLFCYLLSRATHIRSRIFIVLCSFLPCFSLFHKWNTKVSFIIFGIVITYFVLIAINSKLFKKLWYVSPIICMLCFPAFRTSCWDAVITIWILSSDFTKLVTLQDIKNIAASFKQPLITLQDIKDVIASFKQPLFILPKKVATGPSTIAEQVQEESMFELINKLNQRYKNGEITEEEYKKEKNIILERY